VKKKNTTSDTLDIDEKKMKTLHAVLICLLIFAIFTHTATAALGPLIQHENIVSGKGAKHNHPGPPPRRKLNLTTLGDPIEDPTPHEH